MAFFSESAEEPEENTCSICVLVDMKFESISLGSKLEGAHSKILGRVTLNLKMKRALSR